MRASEPTPEIRTHDGMRIGILHYTDPARVERLVRELASADWMYDDLTAADKHAFIRHVLSETLLLDIDGRGVVWFDELTPGFGARLHCVTWSPRLAGRYDVLHLACLFPVVLFNVERVFTLIPAWLRGTLRSASRALEFEGRLRHVFVRGNTWHDGYVLSLLADTIRSKAYEYESQGASLQGLDPRAGRVGAGPEHAAGSDVRQAR